MLPHRFARLPFRGLIRSYGAEGPEKAVWGGEAARNSGELGQAGGELGGKFRRICAVSALAGNVGKTGSTRHNSKLLAHTR